VDLVIFCDFARGCHPNSSAGPSQTFYGKNDSIVGEHELDAGFVWPGQRIDANAFPCISSLIICSQWLVQLDSHATPFGSMLLMRVWSGHLLPHS